MIHLYFGGGKGKTTAAVGLAVRYSGAAKPVVFSQFLKGGSTGELVQLERLEIPVFRQSKKMPFTFQMTAEQKTLCAAEQKAIFDKAAAEALRRAPCLLVLDEIIDVLEAGLLEQAPVEDFLRQQKPGGQVAVCEMVLTGHSAPEWLVQYADYVTEFKKIKHPYDAGTPARKGVEF
ncbi:MAG: cob(I)yrinic acid a,c-diamide adenosyltransferase [Spirochaetaceae bacterium]|jgi:cob(I)alamin adenosyltransferase|nr:cob(I)yrinic acid a,c-diamide adenosyltransferase [Spirochaetaceae bacterium]